MRSSVCQEEAFALEAHAVGGPDGAGANHGNVMNRVVEPQRSFQNSDRRGMDAAPAASLGMFTTPVRRFISAFSRSSGCSTGSAAVRLDDH